MPTYRIDVYTPPRPGDAEGTDGHDADGRRAGGHGTDANVYLTLYGRRASSAELPMGSNGHRFGTTGVDTLVVDLPSLGDITRVHVRHDNTGVAPGWFLDRVVVSDEDAGCEWTFPCQRWLARHHDDGEIERLLDTA